MGTFHIIDSARVKVFYPGNRKTCGQFHQTAEICKGEAIAKDCEENGGPRIHILEHMKHLWNLVGFEPLNFTLDDDEETDNINIKNTVTPKFQRQKISEEVKERINGLSLKFFPKETSRKEILQFLVTKGLPRNIATKDHVVMGSHGDVEIKDITSDMCHDLMEKINFVTTREAFFGKPIYCRLIHQPFPDSETPPKDAKKDTQMAPVNDDENFIFDSPAKPSKFYYRNDSSSDSDCDGASQNFLQANNKATENQNKKRQKTPPSASTKRQSKKNKNS